MTTDLGTANTDHQRITVHIPGIGDVRAALLQRYPDGDVRVRYAGTAYIVKPNNQLTEES